MCGIAGVVYKDGKLHPVGADMTRMLHALQHRGPDSAGFSIYGDSDLRKTSTFLTLRSGKTRPPRHCQGSC